MQEDVERSAFHLVISKISYTFIDSREMYRETESSELRRNGNSESVVGQCPDIF